MRYFMFRLSIAFTILTVASGFLAVADIIPDGKVEDGAEIVCCLFLSLCIFCLAVGVLTPRRDD
jgi:hypothetical protein